MFYRRTLLPLLCAVLAAAQTPNRNRHVVVISLDGFPAYALQDPSLPLPVMRKLIREGGVADGMKPINPTVTWPNHTAIVTGVDAATHGVIYNGMPVRGAEGKPLRVEPWVEKKELVQARTVYDAAHDAGLTTAEADWVAIYHPGTIDWSFAEVPSPDGPLGEGDGGARRDHSRRTGVRALKAPITFRDDIWTRAVVHIIEKHKPNLMLMHLLTTDSVQHQNGARSLAGNTALILADRQIQRVLDAIDRAGIRDQTTVLVVSDHGFKTYQHRIRLNALLRQKGLLREKDGQPDCDAWVVAEGGTAMVYVNCESACEATVKAMRELAGTPGIAKIIMPSEYGEYGYPKVTAQGRMSDMVLAMLFRLVAASRCDDDWRSRGWTCRLWFRLLAITDI